MLKQQVLGCFASCRFIVSGYGWLSGRGLPETFTLQGVPQQNDHEMAINEMFGRESSQNDQFSQD